MKLNNKIFFLHRYDHKNATIQIINLISNDRLGMILIIIAAMSRGNRQYPSKQILWKIEILEPRAWVFTVITKAPAQTITKIVTKIFPLSLELKDRVNDKQIQSKRGPHKSPKYLSNNTIS